MIDLTENPYTFREAAALLGISRNRLWRLKPRLAYPTRIDRRGKRLSAETLRELHAYLYVDRDEA